MSKHNIINLTFQIWREGKMYIAYNPELKVSSCGRTFEESKKNIKEAVDLFIEETEKMGTLEELLEEAGFVKKKINSLRKIWMFPKMLSVEKVNLAF